MNEKNKQYCDLLVDTWNYLKKIFRRDHDKIVLSASTAFVCAGKRPDADKIKMCSDYLKDNTARSSDLRGMMRVPIICKMSMKNEPGIYFEKIQHIVELMKEYKWLNADNRVAAAMVIADCSDGDAHNDTNIRYYLNEADVILNALKDKFGNKMNDKDYVYITMLAASNYEIEPLLDDVYECYLNLSPTFKDGSICRVISYILALGENYPEAKKSKLIDVFRVIEASDMRFGKGYELSMVAPLSLLGNSADVIGKEFLDTEEYLRVDKHCRGYTMKPNIRNLYAALMAFEAHRDEFESLSDFAFGDAVSMMIQIEASVISPSSSSIFSTGVKIG